VDLVVAWLLFPPVLLSLAAGWGCAVTRACRLSLPAELVAPLGLAAIVAASGIVTAIPRAAPLATAVVVGGAVAGLAASWPWRLRASAAKWPAAAALLVFAAYAAPIVLSGSATFAGYLTLDDSATLFAMTDRILEHGRSVDGLAPSTYEATLATSLMVGYPMGSLLPLGIGAGLVDTDVAWAFQPYLAVLAAFLALVLWRLLANAIPARGARLVAVVVAAQPALLYGYGLWTGVKELAAALLIALATALAFERGWFPLAVAAAATVLVLSIAGVVWLLPLLVWVLLAARAALRSRELTLSAAAFVVFALPAVAQASRFLGDGHLESLRDESRLANLLRPLNPLQAFGIWPAGDFRVRPERFWPSVVLVMLVALLAVGGLVSSLRRRDALVPYAACALGGGLVYWVVGSPWIEAKAFSIASPAVLVLAAAGCAFVAASGRRVEAALAATLVVGGVLWSNALAYRDVNLAPSDQLAELERIGQDFAGQGPTLMTEYLPVGARHFLRRLDAEGASELRRRPVPLRDGRELAKLEYANLDAFRLDGLLAYRTLVLRRSPAESRPPAPFRLRWRGRFYEVWQRASGPRVLDHVPLGDATDPAGIAPCAAVRRLAAEGPRVAAVARDQPVAVVPVPRDRADVVIFVPRDGRYSVWLGGSTRDRVGVLVDGRSVGGAAPQLNNLGQYVELATTDLAAGRHTLRLHFEPHRLRPGTGGADYGSGPLVVAPTEPARTVKVLSSERARRLCGRELDWVEALAP